MNEQPDDSIYTVTEMKAIIEDLRKKLEEKTDELISLKELNEKSNLSVNLAKYVVEKSDSVLFRWKASEGWPLEYVSDNILRWGYTKEEFLSGTIIYSDIIHPDDLERITVEVTNYTESRIDNYVQQYRIFKKNGKLMYVEDKTNIERSPDGEVMCYQGIVSDITPRKVAEIERDKLIHDLQNAFSEIKTLSGLIPICSYCKKIRNDNGYWEQLEKYLKSRSDAIFSHGICPECLKEYFPEYKISDD
jgi:PAS domain S-box-containing protein